MIDPKEILNYWYSDSMREHWFNSTPEIDAEILDRFEDLWQQAAKGALDDWKKTPKGCLALCIVLDQFPLNMFRKNPKSFSTEQQAVSVSKLAVEQGFDLELPEQQRVFLYMPLMHSEDMADQDESVRLFESFGLEDNANFARHHREIVRKFGRFPHRNNILGRKSRADEMAYLNSDEAFTG